MGRSLKVLALGGLLAAVAPAIAPPPAQAVVGDIVVPFAYTGGQQSFAVPKGVLAVRITAVGGRGAGSGNAAGGKPAQVTADVPVPSGVTTLLVYVGGNGTSGGFNGGVGGGGGGTDVRTGAALSSRLVVAAGGGGAGGTGTGLATFEGGKGGDAGAPGIAGNGSLSPGFDAGGLPGEAGTATEGGAGGAGKVDPIGNVVSAGGSAGALGVGGTGGSLGAAPSGGGGGGGLYGGGGGASGGLYTGGAAGAGGGGGGSNFVIPTNTFKLESIDESGTPSATIAYDRVPTSLTLTPVLVKISPLGVFIGQVNATLRRNDTGAPIAGEPIAFFSGGKPLCTATTNTAGVASCSGLNLTVTALLSLGYEARFAGAGAYQPSAGSAAILM